MKTNTQIQKERVREKDRRRVCSRRTHYWKSNCCCYVIITIAVPFHQWTVFSLWIAQFNENCRAEPYELHFIYANLKENSKRFSAEWVKEPSKSSSSSGGGKSTIANARKREYVSMSVLHTYDIQTYCMTAIIRDRHP